MLNLPKILSVLIFPFCGFKCVILCALLLLTVRLLYLPARVSFCLTCLSTDKCRRCRQYSVSFW